jgi:hypothetical protein
VDVPSCCRHHAACHGTQWVGQSPRYLWVDIVAGPPSYGPGPGREGGVFPHTAPHPSHYRAHSVNKAIVPDLAALVWSAIQVGRGCEGQRIWQMRIYRE